MNDDTDWQTIAAALSTQLDAERELRKEAEARYSLMQTMEADAIRETVQTLVDALMKIREKCANVGYCDGLVLPCDAVVAVIDDALAKVKEEPVQLPMINEDPVIELK